MTLGRGLMAWLLLLSPAWASTESPDLRIGFYLPAIREVSRADVQVTLGIWIEELRRPLDLRVSTAVYDDMPAMRQALLHGETNFVNAPGMELAEAFRPEEIREGFGRRVDNADQGLVLLVRADSGIHGMADLRGKRLARLERDRLSDILLDTLCLREASLECGDYLAVQEKKRDIQSIHELFFGRVDAALAQLSTLRAASELNPQVGRRLRPILEWKAESLSFGMTTSGTGPELRNRIITSANEALKTPRGRQLLELFKADYLAPADAHALKPYWDLLAEYRKLRERRLGARK